MLSKKNNDAEIQNLKKNIIAVATELQRFKSVFMSAIGKLPMDEQTKYVSQYSWFDKKVKKALAEAGYTCVDIEGKIYDPEMAVTPLNIDEFQPDDILFVKQMIEPIIMNENSVAKTGTVLLGRIEE